VEVLTAVLICGIVFVSLYSGISSGFAFVQLARENLRATQIMEEKMETIRLYRWDQINREGFVPTNFVDVFYPLLSQGSGGLRYTGAVTIATTPFAEFYAEDMRQVTIDLSWVSANVVRKRQMTTLVSRHGLQHYVY
jgi:hypothetical protein